METPPGEELESGSLECTECNKVYPISNGIPRFVDRDNYASSFGLQWNHFRSQQIDSVNGTGISAKRLYSETEWTSNWLCGKWILDVGCGAGRFLDIASRAGSEVVGVDLSSAVDAARATFRARSNVHLVQASVTELPFRSEAFDGLYCIGVIQHTPDPYASLQSLPRVLKPGAPIAVTIYERKWWTRFHGKYLIRPLTKRVNEKMLLLAIKAVMPVVFSLTDLLFRIPFLGRIFRFAIPVANYVDEPRLSLRQRYRWALLDTFDMLAPRYDRPQTEEEVTAALRSARIGDIRRLRTAGVNLVGRRES